MPKPNVRRRSSKPSCCSVSKPDRDVTRYTNMSGTDEEIALYLFGSRYGVDTDYPR
jgi:hypothetical protein